MDTLLTRIWKTVRRPLLLGACAALLLPVRANAGCQLNSASSAVKHVVYVEFDNVHFTRDNPNVPSDLEQMPNLLNFIKDNGTMDAGDHAILISHTASDILSTQTGLYPDRDGIAVANNFGVFGPITGATPNGDCKLSWPGLVGSSLQPDSRLFGMRITYQLPVISS
jgi:hypothetical protein